MKNTQFIDDAPPLYQTITSLPPPGAAHPPSDLKRPLPLVPPTSADPANPALEPLAAALAAAAGQRHDDQGGMVQGVPMGVTAQAWDYLTLGGLMEMWRRKSRVDELRVTLRGLIYDTLRNLTDPGAMDVLLSCQAACRAHSLSFDELIQEDVEGHTPLYWAILAVCHSPSHTLSSTSSAPGSSSASAMGESFSGSGTSSSPFTAPTTLQIPSSPTHPTGPPSPLAGHPTALTQILLLLLSVPLSPRTIQDARAALTLNDANSLFQALRAYPTFEKTSYAESVIGLGAAAAAGQPSSPGGAGQQRQNSITPVLVTHMSDTGVGTFRATWSIPLFSKRVKLAKKLNTQFIARGRAWSVQFAITGGHWVVSLKLLRGSQSTPIDGMIKLGRPLGERVQIRLRKKRLEPGEHVEARLDSVQGGASLEYEDSGYLTPEGTLEVEGEWVLERKDMRGKE